eukprot:SAG11_NODE_3232_length_2595_cov_2.500000_2_plen_170_part_00
MVSKSMEWRGPSGSSLSSFRPFGGAALQAFHDDSMAAFSSILKPIHDARACQYQHPLPVFGIAEHSISDEFCVLDIQMTCGRGGGTDRSRTCGHSSRFHRTRPLAPPSSPAAETGPCPPRVPPPSPPPHREHASAAPRPQVARQGPRSQRCRTPASGSAARAPIVDDQL